MTKAVFRFLADHRQGLIWAHSQRWAAGEQLPADGELKQQVQCDVLADILRIDASTVLRFYLGPEDVGADDVDPEILKTFTEGDGS